MVAKTLISAPPTPRKQTSKRLVSVLSADLCQVPGCSTWMPVRWLPFKVWENVKGGLSHSLHTHTHTLTHIHIVSRKEFERCYRIKDAEGAREGRLLPDPALLSM